MGNVFAKNQSYDVDQRTPGVESRNVSAKSNRKSEKSNPNTPKKRSNPSPGTGSSSPATKLHPPPKAKPENQNTIVEEVEDVEADQTPGTPQTTPQIQTLPEQLTTPVNNPLIIASVITAQSATVIKKTNEEEDEEDDSTIDDDTTPSESNLSSETPSHHATNEKIEVQAPSPTPLRTTPHDSETKVNPEASSPNKSELNLSDVNAEESAVEKIEAKPAEECVEKIEEPKENAADETPVENETGKAVVVPETEEVTVENVTEEAPAAESTAIVSEALAHNPVVKTEEENKEEEEPEVKIEEIVPTEICADVAGVAAAPEEDVKVEDTNLLVEETKISPSAVSNTADGDVKIESSSEVDVQASAEQLHVQNCLEEIAVVKNEAITLESQVKEFSGTKEDREYLHLSEMLMRKLYKLDSIESKKNEEIRKRKKSAVLFVKDVTQILEDRVEANSTK